MVLGMENVATSPLEDTLARLATAREAARLLADDVRRQFGPRVRGIRLFGSEARGDWQATSDVDVLVLLDRVGDGDRDWISGRAVRRGVLDAGIPLAAITLAEEDLLRLRQRERLFAREVDREGVPL